MKLYIENVNKMLHQLIPTKEDGYTWQVDGVNETDGYYHFICERRKGSIGWKIDYVCKLSINRIGEEWVTQMNRGWKASHYYHIDLDHIPTIHYIYNNEVKSMDEVAVKFADILKHIPK